jgi:hypothetical protein
MPEQCCSCGGPCGKGPCRYGKERHTTQASQSKAVVESAPLVRMDDGSPMPDASIIKGLGTGWTTELAADVCDAWATLHLPLPESPEKARVNGVLWGRLLGISHVSAYHLRDSDLYDDLQFLDEVQNTIRFMYN